MARAKKWIQGAVHPSKKGTFTAYCKREGYKGVSAACIRKGEHSSNPTTQRRAKFAAAMKSIAK